MEAKLTISFQGSEFVIQVLNPYLCLLAQDLPGMKPPLFPGNEVNPFGLCIVDQPFKSSVMAPHPGWTWVDKGAKTAFRKWGFVSTQVGGRGRGHHQVFQCGSQSVGQAGLLKGH